MAILPTSINPFRSVHVDLTPGFNIDRHAGGGVPFVSKGNGSTGTAPPKPPAPHPNSASAPPRAVYAGGAHYSSAPSVSAAQQAANQQAIDLANASLGRIPGEVAAARHQVQQTYNQNYNELQSSKDAAQGQYNTSTNQNRQQYVTNKNQISDQASSGLKSLLRVLGQHGAGGSSAAMYAAPDAVGQVASQQRSGASQNFGENQQTLDTNYNNFLGDFQNKQQQLRDWLFENANQASSTGEKNRVNLLQQIAGLQPDTAHAQPYIDQINAAASHIDQLANFNPTYSGKTPVYTAPDVSSYTVQAPGAPVLGTPGGNAGAGSTPLLSYLLGIGKKDQNQAQTPTLSPQGA